jgi:hypothetical protein
MSQNLLSDFPLPVALALAALVLVVVALARALAPLRKPAPIRQPEPDFADEAGLRPVRIDRGGDDPRRG